MAHLTRTRLNGLSGVVDSTFSTVVPQLITSIDFYTNLTDPTRVATADSIVKSVVGKDANAGQGGASQVLSFGQRALAALKPTLQINSPILGVQYYAPYGVADRTKARRNKITFVLAASAVVGGLVAIGYGLGKKAR
jgi:hypothetical protein